MNTEQKQVRQFMVLAQQELPPVPTIPSLGVRILRAKLILEEALETIRKGLGLDLLFKRGDGEDWITLDTIKKISDDGFWVRRGKPNIIEIADGCADIKVVTDGTALACGIDLEPVMAEVSRSNLSKFIDGHRRADGKWVKGPSYSPADIAPILEAQKTPTKPPEGCPDPEIASNGLQQALASEFGPVLDPRQAGETVICEYRGRQMTRGVDAAGRPFIHCFEGDLEYGLITRPDSIEMVLGIMREEIDLRDAEAERASKCVVEGGV